MFTVSGKLLSKTLIKSGVGQHGEWKILEFAIQRTYCKKKITIAFTAKGKWADLVNNIDYKERITVEFVPNVFFSEKHNRYFTELKVITVEKYVSKKRIEIVFNGDVLNVPEIEFIQPSFDLRTDVQNTENEKKKKD
jgi:hypothetical protein